jgi:hypothetical protein
MASVPSLTAAEKARFLQTLREDPAFREEVRHLLLEELQAATQELHELLDHVAEIVRDGFEGVHEILRESGRQIVALTERMDRVVTQIAALTERMERVEGQITILTGRIDALVTHVFTLTTDAQAHRARLDDVAGVAAAGEAIREIRVWLRSRGVEIVEEYLPGDLYFRLGVTSKPDGVMLLQTNKGYVFLVFEATYSLGRRDVRRIADWLAGFQRVGWPAVGLVHFRHDLPLEDFEEIVFENGHEAIHKVPGLNTLQEEATQGGVLLMQQGALPWQPAGWQPPSGLEKIPQVVPVSSTWL